jgi:hypothetical protein
MLTQILINPIANNYIQIIVRIVLLSSFLLFMWRREPRMEERSEEGKRKLRELGILRREIRSRLLRKD